MASEEDPTTKASLGVSIAPAVAARFLPDMIAGGAGLFRFSFWIEREEEKEKEGTCVCLEGIVADASSSPAESLKTNMRAFQHALRIHLHP